MRRLAFLTGVAIFGLTPSSGIVAQAPAAPPLTPFRGLVDLVSKATWPGEANGTAYGDVHIISGDGRYVVFASSSNQLVPGDLNWSYDVFLRDRATGTTSRVSVPALGGEGNNASMEPAISANGRHVAFSSNASNLVSNDTNGWSDVFVRDLDAGRTVRVSLAANGTQGDNGSGTPAISADGRFVAFLSNATTFGAGTPPYGPQQVYVHDRDADADGIFDEPGATTLSRASVAFDGGAVNQSCIRSRISADGRFVMFETSATNLLSPGSSNNAHHLYVYDRVSAQTTLIDRAAAGGPSQSGVLFYGSDMSEDGRFVTYTSPSPDIVPSAGANGQLQVFRYDTSLDPALGTIVVSRRPDGVLGDRHSYSTTVSADGRYVGFTSTATNLAAPAPLYGPAIMLADTTDGSLTRIDVGNTGMGFEGPYTDNPSLSADGTAIAFQSDGQPWMSGFPLGMSVFAVTALSASTPAPVPPEGGSGSIEVNTNTVAGWAASVVSNTDWIALTGGAEYAAGPRTLSYTVNPNPTGSLRTGQIRVGSTLVTISQAADSDATPPQIVPIITGTQGADGWFVSDVTVSWAVSDPDSGIVSQSPACAQTTIIANDTAYFPVTCEAASDGGTNRQTVVVRRDATALAISIAWPQPTIYAQTAATTPVFSCSDGGSSGLATCAISSGSDPLDMTPGRHVFAVTATNQAGASTTRSVEYVVESAACVSLPLAPAHLLRWWKLDGNLRDGVTRRDAIATIDPGTFQAAVAQLGWDNTSSGNVLRDWNHPSATLAGQGLTVAAWVLPRGSSSPQTIVSNTLQYRIDRDVDGTLRWAFKTAAGVDSVDTGVQVPASVWSHVAVTYADGVVTSYVNGRLVHSAPLGAALSATGDSSGAVMLGGHYDTATLNGRIDDVMIFDAALSSAEIDGLALGGRGSLCAPLTSTLSVTASSPIAYGSSFQVSAQLTAGGRPLANRSVTFTSPISPGTVANGTTDATGSFTTTLAVDPSTPMGEVPDGVVASFAGDDVFGAAEAHAGTTVVAGTPPLELASHLIITYGRPVDDLFVAFSSVPGTFTFSPASGTMLDAGTYPLSVTLTPYDLTHWAPRTLTRPMVVRQARPVIEVPAAPLVYNAQPRQADVVVRGVDGAALSPFTVLYNGGTPPPVNAGTYALQVSYAGTANYEAVTDNRSFVISKATPAMPAIGNTSLTYDGQPHGISATVTGVQGESLTPVVVTYNGSAAVPVNAGTYAIQARYDGAPNYTAVSRTATLTILKAAPSITWPTPAGITYGTPLGAAQLNASANVPGTFAYSPAAGSVLNAGLRTLSVTFTPADTTNYATATSSVTLNVARATPSIAWSNPAGFVYGAALSAAQLNATASVPGTFVYAPAAGTVLPAGTSTLSVTFTPTNATNYTNATASQPLTVIPAPLTVRAQDVSKVFGAPVPSLTATVVGFVNGDSLASLTGSLVVTSPATPASPIGTYVIVPSGVSSSNYTIGFVNGTLTVARASTSTSLTTSPNPAGVNQPVTLTALVSVVAPGAGVPTGAVEFYAGTVLLGSAPLSGGTASLTTSGFAPGTHSLSASYLGDASFTGSPASATLTVNTSGASSTTAVTSSANPSNAGQNVTLTATVSAPGGLNGSVAFYDGSTLIGTAALSGTAAQLTTASLALGGHAITARYLGNATIPPSTSPAFAQYVRPSGANTRTSTVALAASPSPAALGSTVTLTATVTGSQNKAPTGVVLFMVNGFVLGQSTVTQTGSVTAVATLPTSALPHGTHRVEAVYLGDNTFRASRTQITLVVN